MIKNSFILLFLILCPFIDNIDPIYRPMSKRNKDFDGDLQKKKIDFDDLCFYSVFHSIHGDDSSALSTPIIYVKGCDKGKICKSFIDTTIQTCQSINKLSLLTMEESCNYSLQCDGNLKCINGMCSLKENDEAYEKGGFYFCPSGYIPVKIEDEDPDDIDYICRKSSEYNPNGRYFYLNKDNGKSYFYAPEFLYYPGEIIFNENEVPAIDRENNNKEVKVKVYSISEIKTATIASLEDGTFVKDPKTCKSGIAVKYYADKSLEVPSYDSNTRNFYRCVSVEEVDKKNCLIKYNLDSIEITLHLDSDYISSDCDNIDIVLEMFEKFKDKMSKCESHKYDEEPLTCGREDLRKYLYFYKNPDIYRLYRDEKEIIDYFILNGYQSSSYLWINPILLLILFFL